MQSRLGEQLEMVDSRPLVMEGQKDQLTELMAKYAQEQKNTSRDLAGDLHLETNKLLSATQGKWNGVVENINIAKERLATQQVELDRMQKQNETIFMQQQ